MDGKGNNNKGRVVIYQFRVKHRGELPKAFIELVKKAIWVVMGDVSMDDIVWRKVNNTRSSGD